LRSILAIIVLLLGFATNAQAQGGQLVISIAPPAPQPFTIQVNQKITLNGISYNTVGTLTLTPTTEIPPPPVAAISQVVSSNGTAITAAQAGSTVTVQGTNLGTAGTVTVADLSSAVVSWSPTAITITLPASSTGAVGPIVVTPTGASAVTSSFQFAITVGSTEIPPPEDVLPWLFVTGYTDKNGVESPETIVEGDPLTVLGHRFQDRLAESRVEVNNSPALIVDWRNDSIQVVTAPLYNQIHNTASVLVWRQIDEYYFSKAPFKVMPRPQ
jgi:hypothetical protein